MVEYSESQELAGGENWVSFLMIHCLGAQGVLLQESLLIVARPHFHRPPVSVCVYGPEDIKRTHAAGREREREKEKERRKESERRKERKRKKNGLSEKEKSGIYTQVRRRPIQRQEEGQVGNQAKGELLLLILDYTSQYLLPFCCCFLSFFFAFPF